MHNDISFPQHYKLWGADTETVRGEPYTLQISGDGRTADLLWVNKDNVLDTFLEYFRDKISQSRVNAVYFHNLAFDLAVLLYKYHEKWRGAHRLDMTYKGVKLNFVISKTYFGTIRYDSKRILRVLDSKAFFVKSSLADTAHALSLPLAKMTYNQAWEKAPSTSPEFIKYAKNDALLQYMIAKNIFDQFEKYNTRVCVSLPSFAVRVFRHYCMRERDILKFPPHEAVRGCLLSYHGGKNGWYVDRPTVVKNCYEYDITSAYPYAMYNMPNFLRGEYIKVNKINDKYEGIYRIAGTIKPCKYPILFDHEFKPLKGDFASTWVTSYELKEALRMNEVKIKSVHGYIWRPDKNYRERESAYNPFKVFVEMFFMKKSEAKSEIDRFVAKLILNSLYGKTIQTIEDNKRKPSQFDDIDFIKDAKTGEYYENKNKNIFFAGGMFNPFIATLITGHTRAYLHALEHKYQALHASTDSIKSIIPVDKADLADSYNNEMDKLGKLKVEVKGTCYMIRNKLYLHYNEKDELKKYALHGFIGKKEQLRELFDAKKNNYTAKHIFKVKEALIQGLKPLTELEVDRKLYVDFSRIDYIN